MSDTPLGNESSHTSFPDMEHSPPAAGGQPDRLAELRNMVGAYLVPGVIVDELYGLAEQAQHEIERLRRFPAVWTVQHDNEYGYPEVIALYDNERAARAHAAMSVDPLEVEEMEVRSDPPRLSGGPLET
jgi:hypothetical protein